VTRRRLLRPAVVLPALVLLSLGAGIAYAAWTQLDSGRADANERLLDSLPNYPGAEELERLTRSSADSALPVPDQVVTSVLYAPPASAKQADVVDFYVSALTPEWEARTETVPVGADETGATRLTAFRVDFSREDACVMLLTFGMAPGHLGERTFALSAEAGQGSCEPG
jgi:hypothetical protein